MPQKTRVGNDRSQSTTDVPRRRNRNEKLYKARARSSVTLAAQNADRMAAVSDRIGAIDPLQPVMLFRSGRSQTSPNSYTSQSRIQRARSAGGMAAYAAT